MKDRDKKKVVLLLRWTVIFVVGYLILFGKGRVADQRLSQLLIIGYILSNLLPALLPKAWFSNPKLFYSLVFGDTGIVSFGMYLSEKMTTGFYLVFFLILVGMACPSPGGTTDHPMAQIIIVDKNFNGKTIEAKVGNEIQIELESIGGTGFSWYFDELDTTFFERGGERTKAITREGELIGGNPVIMVWALRAKKPGNTLIKLSYYRVWEGRNSAIKRFEVEVHINP